MKRTRINDISELWENIRDIKPIDFSNRVERSILDIINKS